MNRNRAWRHEIQHPLWPLDQAAADRHANDPARRFAKGSEVKERVTTVPDWYDNLGSALAEYGLVTRGAFHPSPGDGVPGDPGTLVLAGNAGPDMWRAFAGSMPDGSDPLDAWSQVAIGAVASRCRATPLFPFAAPPYLPFQRWAAMADSVSPSPLGILIHRQFGLWHGYRGALAFTDRLPLPPRDDTLSPCEACADKPCLSACPVAAFTEAGYDVDACAGHLLGPEGQHCMTRACLARHACPVGQDYVYPPDQAAFHMRAFLAARGK